MRSPVPDSPRRPNRSLRRVSLSLGILLLIGSATPAAWASANHPDGDAHACACGMKCKPGKCCCAPHRKDSPTTRGRSGPCLDSAPCGDPASPAPVLPSIKLAVLATSEARIAASPGRPWTIEPPESAGLIPADRLEDPPDRA